MNRKRKVLLVDDDVAFLKANALILERAGYAVLTAQDGRAGLAAAREHQPDLIIADVIMNRPDEGFAFARAVRADTDLVRTKLIVLTAAGQHYQMLFEPDEQWLPVDKVLEKPTAAEDLISEIENVLNKSDGDTEGRT